MTIIREERLANFEFWSGAKYLAEKLTEEFDIIEGLLEELCPDGMEETEVNNFFWFDGDTIAQTLGYEDEDDLIQNRGVTT